jgi:hypothetical protein
VPFCVVSLDLPSNLGPVALAPKPHPQSTKHCLHSKHQALLALPESWRVFCLANSTGAEATGWLYVHVTRASQALQHGMFSHPPNHTQYPRSQEVPSVWTLCTYWCVVFEVNAWWNSSFWGILRCCAVLCHRLSKRVELALPATRECPCFRIIACVEFRSVLPPAVLCCAAGDQACGSCPANYMRAPSF